MQNRVLLNSSYAIESLGLEPKQVQGIKYHVAAEITETGLIQPIYFSEEVEPWVTADLAVNGIESIFCTDYILLTPLRTTTVGNTVEVNSWLEWIGNNPMYRGISTLEELAEKCKCAEHFGNTPKPSKFEELVPNDLQSLEDAMSEIKEEKLDDLYEIYINSRATDMTPLYEYIVTGTISQIDIARSIGNYIKGKRRGTPFIEYLNSAEELIDFVEHNPYSKFPKVKEEVVNGNNFLFNLIYNALEDGDFTKARLLATRVRRAENL